MTTPNLKVTRERAALRERKLIVEYLRAWAGANTNMPFMATALLTAADNIEYGKFYTYAKEVSR